MNLKKKITLFIGGAFLCGSFLFTVLAYMYTGDLLKTQIRNEQLNLAKRTGATIDQWLEVRKGMVTTAAAEAGQSLPDQPDAMLKKFEILSKSGGFLSIYVGLKDGTFYDSSGWTPPQGWDARSRPWYQMAMSARATILTKPYVDANSGDLIISIATPVVQNGTTIGVASSDINLGEITAEIINTDVSGDGYAMVMHEDGTILMHPNSELMDKKIQGLDPTLADMYAYLNGKTDGTYEYHFQNEDKMLSFSRTAETDWYTQITVSKDSIFGPLQELLMLMVILGIIIVAFGTATALYIARNVALPLGKTVSMIKELEAGHLDTRLNMQRRDEIGEMARTMDRFADNLQNEIVDILQKLAAGRLDFDIEPRDGRDQIRQALKTLGKDLSEIVSELQVSGNQIANGSSQVADTSQSLSQGATEQASSLEEISASLNEISSKTQTNAEYTSEANTLAGSVRQAAEQSQLHMQSMVEAMADISEAGQSINKIIKTIDEIAFQTNLLALNAAVEAARAGQHGKGFAVVAEEVRNLAARSSKAAEETAALIQGTVEKTDNGSVIANKTAESLQDIYEGIDKVSNLIGDIAIAGNEQAQGINQINSGITQIDQVTQQNTAHAEESASAAEELSGQAEQLREMMQRFVLKNNRQVQVSETIKTLN